MALTPIQWFAVGAGLYAGIGLPLAFVWWFNRRYRLHRPLPTGPDEVDVADLLDQTESQSKATLPSTAALSLGPRNSPLGQANSSHIQAQRTLSPSPSDPSTASFTAPTATTRESVSTVTSPPPSFRDSLNPRVQGYGGTRDSLGHHGYHARDPSTGAFTAFTTDIPCTARYSNAGSNVDYRSVRDSYSTVTTRGTRHTFTPAPHTQRSSFASDATAPSWRYPQNWPVDASASRDPLISRPPSQSLPRATSSMGTASPPLTMPVPVLPPPQPVLMVRNVTPAPSVWPCPTPKPASADRPPSALAEELKRHLETPHAPGQPKSPGAVTILKDVLFSEPEQVDSLSGPSNGQQDRVVVRNEEDAEAVRLELLPPQYRPEWAEGHSSVDGDEKAGAPGDSKCA